VVVAVALDGDLLVGSCYWTDPEAAVDVDFSVVCGCCSAQSFPEK